MSTGAQPKIKVLDKMFSIVDVIINHSDERGSIGVNDISKISGINPATTYRILQSLKANGWVIQDRNDKYMVGLKLYTLINKNKFFNSLKEIAYFVMKEITKSESQAMNMAIRQHDKCIILNQSRTNKLLDYVLPKGSELYFHATACGKVLLSELPELLLNEILNSIDFKVLTPKTITKKSHFLNELELVRKRGYALDIHESLEMSSCIAVPIRDKHDEIIAALSFSGILVDLDEKEIEYYVDVLKKGAQKITQML